MTYRRTAQEAGVTVEFRNDEAQRRYELVVDGSVASYADYDLDGTVMVLPHTVTDPASRGQGRAGQLVGQVLDDARARGFTVVPACWYVAQFIDQHPEYADLVHRR
jgi:uncharacterized protein